MDLPLVIARFLHLTATMTLFGGCFFVAVLAPASARADLAPLLRRLVAPLAWLALASAVAWLVFVARAMAGGELDIGALGEVLAGTSFGVVWRARLAILILLVILALRPDPRWRLIALVSGLAVASLGLVGHAAMQEGALGLAHRANRAVHLLTTAGWLGGLPPFLVCLGVVAKSPERHDALSAMMRFSRVGHFAVAAIFATGALDVAMTAHAFPWPPDSPYRRGLDAKFLVFAAMVSLALANRYVLTPRIGRRAAARALAACAAAEFILALTAVALVSAFATFNPNGHN